MKTLTPLVGRTVSVVITALLMAPGFAATAADEKAEAKKDYVPESVDEFPTELRNWVEVGFGGTFIEKGDGAQFMRQHQTTRGAIGGIESLHLEWDIGKKGLFKVDAKGIYDRRNYDVKMELSHPEKGFFRAGYSQARTFYDGSGGYNPTTGSFFEIFNDQLALDRGAFWFEGGLTMPDLPKVTLRYEHQWRDGMKDSLIWGESTTAGGRGIVPSFYDIDEKRDIITLDVAHTIKNTDLNLGVRLEQMNQDNSRNMRRLPLEVGKDRFLTHRDQLQTDMFSTHMTSETRVNDQFLFTTGYGFTMLDGEATGDRIYGSSYEAIYDPVFANRQARDEGFLGLIGGTQTKQHVANVNLMWNPAEHLAIIPGIKIEKQDQESDANYLETNVGSPVPAPAVATPTDPLNSRNDRGILDVSESLEVRYTGLTNWVFYTKNYWMEGRGDLNEVETDIGTATTDLLRATDFERFTQKYAVGANWYPCRKANFSLQYYFKNRTEDYEHTQDSTPSRTGNVYPAFLLKHRFDTHDFNFRVTLRPLANLTCVTRYDYQGSQIHMQGAGLALQESADITTHVLNESVSWTPFSRLALQGMVTYVLDTTETPAQAQTGTPLVLNSQNDYWTATAMSTFVLDNKTDLTTSYTYYRADNYQNNSAFSVPYGAGAEQHTLTASLVRRISERMVWSLKYGLFSYRDQAVGGFNDYRAHLAYTSIRIHF